MFSSQRIKHSNYEVQVFMRGLVITEMRVQSRLLVNEVVLEDVFLRVLFPDNLAIIASYLSFTTPLIERHGYVVETPPSYTGGPGVKCQPGEQH
jgi:hypothetical protein